MPVMPLGTPFAAVADCGIPDPLSRRARSRTPTSGPRREFLERPEPADDGDPIDPLVSIAASLAQLIDAMLYPLPGDAAAEEELAQNLRGDGGGPGGQARPRWRRLHKSRQWWPSPRFLTRSVPSSPAGGAPQRVLRPLVPQPQNLSPKSRSRIRSVCRSGRVVAGAARPDAPVEWRVYVRARGYTSPGIRPAQPIADPFAPDPSAGCDQVLFPPPCAGLCAGDHMARLSRVHDARTTGRARYRPWPGRGRDPVFVAAADPARRPDSGCPGTGSTRLIPGPSTPGGRGWRWDCDRPRAGPARRGRP